MIKAKDKKIETINETKSKKETTKIYYETKPVFDCQEFPKKVKEAFFNHTDGWSAGNDVYVDVSMPDLKEIKENPEDYFSSEYSIILYDFLIGQGIAEDEEEVIIKHWW